MDSQVFLASSPLHWEKNDSEESGSKVDRLAGGALRAATGAAPRYERGKHSVYHALRVAPPTY